MDAQNSKVMKKMFSYIIPLKNKTLIACLLLLVSSVSGFFQPQAIREITDKGISQSDISKLFFYVLTLGLLILISQIVELIVSDIFAEIHNSFLFSLFRDSFKKILSLKKEYFLEKNDSEILVTVQKDIEKVASITDRYTITSISYILKVIGGTIGLFLISWKMSLIVLSMVPIKILLVNVFSKKREKTYSTLIDRERSFSQWFGDNLEGIDEIKLWNLYSKQENAFTCKQKEILCLKKHNIMISSFNSFWEAILEWSIVLALYLFGGLLVHETTLTIGAVFAFVTYSWYVTAPISSLINLKIFFAEVIPSARRLFCLLDTEGEDSTDIPQKNIVDIKRLEFQRVSFSYHHDKPVLSSVSFHIDKGEKIAIIGKNGSGKTTILNLLLRFLSPDSGAILINGEPIQTYLLDDYRSLFSVISQDPFLFLGDIIENIDLVGTATWSEISNSMKESGMIDFIENLPEKEHTNVGRNGAKLSGGEKQKIALARILIRKSPFLILDEPSTGLDIHSDAILHDILFNHSDNQSVIMITHQYEHLSEMDRVYCLDNGQIYELQKE